MTDTEGGSPITGNAPTRDRPLANLSPPRRRTRPDRRCRWCNGTLTGRRDRTTCAAAHRQALYRARHAVTPDTREQALGPDAGVTPTHADPPVRYPGLVRLGQVDASAEAVTSRTDPRSDMHTYDSVGQAGRAGEASRGATDLRSSLKERFRSDRSDEPESIYEHRSLMTI